MKSPDIGLLRHITVEEMEALFKPCPICGANRDEIRRRLSPAPTRLRQTRNWAPHIV